MTEQTNHSPVASNEPTDLSRRMFLARMGAAAASLSLTAGSIADTQTSQPLSSGKNEETMKTVHIILQSHVDPVWLWPWTSGLDSALNTCRSMCDRLDAHPDIYFSFGEAWVYREIELVDPALFKRIHNHVRAGRWEITGGWWIQPDCNQPSGFALERQIELGKRYFMDRFGKFPAIGMNVDSFGHAATLPTMMHSAGQTCYIMMRPQECEMTLPARLFRWRQRDGSPEIVTFRISESYGHHSPTEANVRAALSAIPEGINDTMLFVGVGDHGGGSTEAHIADCRKLQDSIPGVKLMFSTTECFFKAVADKPALLPVVTGELQHHAIGCYTTYRPIKTSLRRAEHLMAQVEACVAAGPVAAETRARLDEAWEHVVFNHFHDTLGGTCVPSAYPQVEAQLGAAMCTADTVLHHTFRKRLSALSDDPMQRVVLLNASDMPFEGFTSVEPWLIGSWNPAWRILDEAGKVVPYQLTDPEAAVHISKRVLFHTDLAPGKTRVLRIDRNPSGPTPDTAGATSGGPGEIANASGVRVIAGNTGAMHFDSLQLPLPRLDLIEDRTDTWSHGIDRYAEIAIESASWGETRCMDSGPLMSSLLVPGHVGRSELLAEYRVYRDMPFVELLLRVNWCECERLLKLTLPLPTPLGARIDGIPGGSIERPPSGQERPLRDWSMLSFDGGNRLGVVCPDVYALDALPARVRFTLLRSCYMAFHVPYPPSPPRGVVSDQGTHTFRFRFFGTKSADTARLDREAIMLQRPLVAADLTRGMKPSDVPIGA